MDLARIAELLKPFLECSSETGCQSLERSDEESAVLSRKRLESISTYIDILMRWNSRINLTAIRDEEQIVTRHFGESLFAARHLFPGKNHVGTAAPDCPVERCSTDQELAGIDRGRAALQGRVTDREQAGALAPEVADFGSGAGFPGIPLKLWAPHIHLTLIESNHKKATFLREVTRALILMDINILTVRAETLPPAAFNLVTLRAVERFETILPIAARLVTPGGRLALLIGESQLQPAKQTLTGLHWEEPLSVPQSKARILLVGSML